MNPIPEDVKRAAEEIARDCSRLRSDAKYVDQIIAILLKHRPKPNEPDQEALELLRQASCFLPKHRTKEAVDAYLAEHAPLQGGGEKEEKYVDWANVDRKPEPSPQPTPLKWTWTRDQELYIGSTQPESLVEYWIEQVEGLPPRGQVYWAINLHLDHHPVGRLLPRTGGTLFRILQEAQELCQHHHTITTQAPR
jgi:hypothetical protein